MKAKWFNAFLVVTMLVIAIVPAASAAPLKAGGSQFIRQISSAITTSFPAGSQGPDVNGVQTPEIRAAERAAEAGMVEDLFVVGALYQQRGQLEQAMGWHTRAAAAGNVTSMMSLGHIFFQRGDHSQAMGWVRQAAAAGEPNSIELLQSLPKDTP